MVADSVSISRITLSIIKNARDLDLAQNPSNATVNTASQAVEAWKTYRDPEGKFTIQHPSLVQITPKQNRFDTDELSFSNLNQSITGYLTYTPEEIKDTSPLALKQIVEGQNAVVRKVLDEFRVISSNDTQLDGGYAISQITYDRIAAGSEKGSWEVFSFKDNKVFKFAYISTTDDFDKGLPTVHEMLNSDISDKVRLPLLLSLPLH